MKTIEEIENYIKEQEQNGALLVTGKWGSGKTYLMRQIERKLNQGPQYLMAVVSLFGIEDTNTLIKKVKEAVVYAQTFNKAEKSGKGHIANTLCDFQNVFHPFVRHRTLSRKRIPPSHYGFQIIRA